MDSEERFRVERAKWDAVAKRRSHPTEPLPENFGFREAVSSKLWLSRVAEFFGDLEGKRVLEYGCGLGTNTVLLAKSGAQVTAFDLSEESINVTREWAALNGVEDAVTLTVTPAERLPYDDESFDIVFGSAVLHHLDVGSAGPELHRVMKVGAKAAFIEPMGMNPLLNFARDHLPYRHKNPRGADHPLTYADIAAWGEGFTTFRFHEIALLAMLGRIFGRRLPSLPRIDEALLRRAPFLRRYCRSVVLFMVK